MIDQDDQPIGGGIGLGIYRTSSQTAVLAPGLLSNFNDKAGDVDDKPNGHKAGSSHSATIGYAENYRLNLPDTLNCAVPERKTYDLIKRIVDFVAATFFLLMLLPVFIFIALSVKLTSKGSVLFRQTRLGYRGKKFTCYKFRSMVVDAESLLRRSQNLKERYHEQGFKIKNDPRVTPVGKILRKTSLDELPQLINVLLGDISLIGPRPIVPDELVQYGQFAEKFLSVPPGLSGLWQTSGRSETSYAERVRLDMTYIDTRSLSLDIRLMFRTLSCVIKGAGAH